MISFLDWTMTLEPMWVGVLLLATTSIAISSLLIVGLSLMLGFFPKTMLTGMLLTFFGLTGYAWYIALVLN